MEENNNPFDAPPTSFFVQSGNQTIVDSPQENSTLVPQENSPLETSPPDIFSNPFSNANLPAQQDDTKQQYVIVDLFWLINPKFYLKQQPIQGESHVTIISFNASFGNLRISCFDLTNKSIQGNLIYLENLKRTVTGTIYPATAFNIYNSPRIATICLEQLFKQIPNATWQQERPVCTVEKNEEKIRLSIKDPKNGNYFYDFIGWQRDAFQYACQFICTKGYELSAHQQILRNTMKR